MTAHAVGLSDVVVLVEVVDVDVLVPAVAAGLGWLWVVVVVELLSVFGAEVGGSSATMYSIFVSLGAECYVLILPARENVETLRCSF